MNWKMPSPKPSVSSPQTTQKPGSITASMVYSKTENALKARNTFLRAFYETAGFVKVFVFAFVFSLVAFLLLPLLLPFLDWCIHLGLLSALCVNLH
jgi:multidrug efflux pump subunit AcrB